MRLLSVPCAMFLMGSLCGGTGETCTGYADTACVAMDSPSGSTTLLEFVAAVCAEDLCTWSAEGSGPIGSVRLRLTNDVGQVDEIIWEEEHDAFSLVDPENRYGGETMAIDLTLVADPVEQIDNNSTGFDVNDANTDARLTVEFTIYDGEGNESDCAVYGADPTFFDCQIVWQ